jgi:hypothetical protein
MESQLKLEPGILLYTSFIHKLTAKGWTLPWCRQSHKVYYFPSLLNFSAFIARLSEFHPLLNLSPMVDRFLISTKVEGSNIRLQYRPAIHPLFVVWLSVVKTWGILRSSIVTLSRLCRLIVLRIQYPALQLWMHGLQATQWSNSWRLVCPILEYLNERPNEEHWNQYCIFKLVLDHIRVARLGIYCSI